MLNRLQKFGAAFVLLAAAVAGLVFADWPVVASSSDGIGRVSSSSGSNSPASNSATNGGTAAGGENDDVRPDLATHNRTTAVGNSAEVEAVIPADSHEGQLILKEISQQAFVEATLTVANAFNSTFERAEPNLNSLQASENAPHEAADPDGTGTHGTGSHDTNPDSASANNAANEALNEALSAGPQPDPDATGRLRLVVSLPSRNNLGIIDAWHAQHAWLLDNALAVSGVCTDCEQLRRQLTPSFIIPPEGDLERVAARRTAGTHISPATYLAAAYELGLWRPIEVNPAVARIFRLVAAETRRHTASGAASGAASGTASGLVSCDISALWIAAAVESELPMQGPALGGFITIEGTELDIVSMSRTAARRGCQAAAVDPLSDTPFWSFLGSVSLSRKVSPAIQPLLERWNTYNPDALDSYRACDSVESILPAAEMTRVRGFYVHPCLAEGLTALLTAARADGIVLRGGAWRSTSRQVTLRLSNCRLPSRSSDRFNVAVSLAPSTDCNPPTAPPGRSRHESGRAVDFTCGNNRAALGRGRCYDWLVENAHKYGLYNLASEPWHWSSDGY